MRLGATGLGCVGSEVCRWCGGSTLLPQGFARGVFETEPSTLLDSSAVEHRRSERMASRGEEGEARALECADQSLRFEGTSHTVSQHRERSSSVI